MLWLNKVLLSAVAALVPKRQNKTQGAQNETQEVPSEQEKKQLFPGRVTKYRNRLLREAVEPKDS